MRLLSIAILAGWICCSAALAEEKKHPVKAELLADASAIKPGETFHIGVNLVMDDGWHVYWLNPGDSGLPTTVAWKVPEGFKVVAMEYPAPVQFDQAGGVVGYGYRDSVLLIAKVTAPADLKPGTKIQISATASWLVCKDLCLPGKAKLSLELPAEAASKHDHGDLFAGWLEQIPAMASEQADVKASNDATGRVITLMWHGPVKNVQVFTVPGDAYVVNDLKADTTGRVSTIRYTTRKLDQSAGPVEMTVLVAYDDASGKRRSIKLIEPLGQK